MTALIERHMLAGPVGRVVRGMTVVGGHCMPEGTPCCPDTATSVTYQLSSLCCAFARLLHGSMDRKTYEGAITTVYPSIVRVASRKGGRVGLLH